MAPISFARGAPTLECIDADLISDCARAALARDGVAILSYGPGGGYGPLRQLLAEQHGVDPSRVFVTTGGLQGFVFYSAVQLLRRPGRVLVEAPTYDRPLKLLAWQGAEVVAIPQDEHGLDLDALDAEVARGGEISFVYTIPTFQNPSGRTLALDRRQRLVELAQRHGLDVLEDDPYGKVRYEGDAVPSIQSLEGGTRVAFTSSFSKTAAAPGLRVGWFVVPEEMKAAFDDRATSTYISPSLLPQAIIHELHLRGAFETNLARVNDLLRKQKDAMLEALAREMPDGVTWSKPDGGYFLWVDFGAGVDVAELLRQVTEAGVTFVKGSDFFPGGAGGQTAARLAFSYESPARIAEGVRIIASALER
ncbi:MAG: PLP-dependent aminotransferase family protein [Actinobacteria bacterium]|nr:PLP-dependent aminotransferase family protein [Actinomycetota bacterium]